MDEKALRANLLELLQGGQAHATAEEALRNIPAGHRRMRPREGLHSIYELVEHLRTAQEDIVNYTIDRTWESPKWPDEYWPRENEEITDSVWEGAVSGFLEGLEKVKIIVQDEKIRMTDRIPHGEGRTYLREILLVADHNAFHIGQIVQMRKILGDWKA